MEPVLDPDLSRQEPAVASGMQVPGADALEVPSPLMKPTAMIRNTQIVKVYTRSRTKYLEAKKIEQIRKSTTSKGKSAERATLVYTRSMTKKLQATLTDQAMKSNSLKGKSTETADETFFNQMKYGKFQRPSMVDLCNKLFNQQQGSTSDQIKHVDNAFKDFALQTFGAQADNIPQTDKVNFLNGDFYAKSDISGQMEMSPRSPKQAILYDNSIRNFYLKKSSNPAPTFPVSDVENLPGERRAVRIGRPSMVDLFNRAFDQGKPSLSNEQASIGNIASTSIPKTNYKVLHGRSSDYLDNPEIKIQFTDCKSDVCHLFSSFVGEKAKLIRSIGFHGLCSFPSHECIDLRFYIWILSKIDVRRSSISLGPDRTVPIHDYDINLITGLPCRGHSVIRKEKSPLIKKTVAAQVKKFLSVGDQDAFFTVSYVESVLTRQYNSPMSAGERYGFCIAAAVYAISCFLAVESGEPKFPLQLIKSLVDPLEIKSHNWCQLVRKSLLTEAAYVQNQISLGQKTIKVGGCPFIAKVLYLDNLKFWPTIVPDNIFPRGSVYTQERVDKLIRQDTKINVISNTRQFGNHEFRREYEICFTRIVQDSLPAIGPLPSEGLKRKREQSDDASVMTNKENDARRKAVDHRGRQLCVAQLILKLKEKMLSKTPMRSTDMWRTKFSTNGSTSVPSLDLNLKLPDVESAHHDGNNPPLDVKPVNMAMQADLLKMMYEDPISKCLKFYNNVRRTAYYDLSGIIWFDHKEPFLIKMSAETLTNESARGIQYGFPYTDSVLRSFTTTEDNIYKGTRKRVKHYMPYSWSHAVLTGSCNGGVKHFKECFISEFFKYDVQKCDQIVVIVEVNGNRCCYIWDFLKKEILVLDPTMQNVHASKIKLIHEGVALFLNDCLGDCIREFFPSWKYYSNLWVVVCKNDVSTRSKRPNSGLYALIYAQYYDCTKLRVPIENTDLGEFRARHLWEVINIPGNLAAKPKLFPFFKSNFVAAATI